MPEKKDFATVLARQCTCYFKMDTKFNNGKSTTVFVDLFLSIVDHTRLAIASQDGRASFSQNLENDLATSRLQSFIRLRVDGAFVKANRLGIGLGRTTDEFRNARPQRSTEAHAAGFAARIQVILLADNATAGSKGKVAQLLLSKLNGYHLAVERTVAQSDDLIHANRKEFTVPRGRITFKNGGTKGTEKTHTEKWASWCVWDEDSKCDGDIGRKRVAIHQRTLPCFRERYEHSVQWPLSSSLLPW